MADGARKHELTIVVSSATSVAMVRIKIQKVGLSIVLEDCDGKVEGNLSLGHLLPHLRHIHYHPACHHA